MRRGSIVQLVLIGVVAGGIASALALIPNWLPPAASDEAGRIDFVFWFVTGICIFIFAIVAAVSTYAVLNFRRKPDDDTDGPPIHGHTGLEITWTAIPAILVTARTRVPTPSRCSPRMTTEVASTIHAADPSQSASSCHTRSGEASMKVATRKRDTGYAVCRRGMVSYEAMVMKNTIATHAATPIHAAPYPTYWASTPARTGPINAPMSPAMR